MYTHIHIHFICLFKFCTLLTYFKFPLFQLLVFFIHCQMLYIVHESSNWPLDKLTKLQLQEYLSFKNIYGHVSLHVTYINCVHIHAQAWTYRPTMLGEVWHFLSAHTLSAFFGYAIKNATLAIKQQYVSQFSSFFKMTHAFTVQDKPGTIVHVTSVNNIELW